METLAQDDFSLMTADEFTDWSLPLEGRWELVAGVPMRMQAEGRRHSRTSRHLAGYLERLLDGHPCTPDERVDVLCGHYDIRQPDVLIDCAPEAAASDSSRAFRPIVVFEVAVTSAVTDLGGKHLTYFRNAEVQHYVAILPEQRRVAHFRRGAGEPVWLGAGDRLDLLPEPSITIEIDEMF